MTRRLFAFVSTRRICRAILLAKNPLDESLRWQQENSSSEFSTNELATHTATAIPQQASKPRTERDGVSLCKHMTKEIAQQQIQKEFATANHAQSIGNEGMVRVCARRAAGVAVAFWLQSNPRTGWGVDAMNQLRSLALDEMTPHEVRDAAQRLTTRITEQFTSAFLTNPIDDANIIINYLMKPT